MLIKFFKIFCLILLLISQSPVYSKNKDIKEFNSKNFSSYFSALVSYDNQKNPRVLLLDVCVNSHSHQMYHDIESTLAYLRRLEGVPY